MAGTNAEWVYGGGETPILKLPDVLVSNLINLSKT
jgi:hypothetical protein